MAVYYRRSLFGRILLVLIAVPVVAYLARLTYEWLLPLLPFVGGAILLMLLWWVGFRRRY